MKLFLAILCCAICSCSSLLTKVVENDTLLKPAVAFVITVTLDQSKTSEERAAKVAVLNKVADEILKAEFDKKPTKAEISNLILKNLPDSAWSKSLAEKVADQYEKATKRISDENVDLSVKALKQVAEGIKEATN